ncbi:MAG: cysteine desulfurase [Cyclobacteriaceae bacterium]
MTGLESIRAQFPIFDRHRDLIYLDNAATTQKPQAVIDRLAEFYSSENANIHRGLYDLSSRATANFEEVRLKVANLIGAEDPLSIAFTKGTTDSINLIAQGYLKRKLGKGDKVVISAMEHHSNLIPWQQLCKARGAELAVIPVSSKGELILDGLEEIFEGSTKLLAITHVSNTLGTINPIQSIVKAAHLRNIPVLLDAAQSVGHLPFKVSDLDADFVAFSAHKMFGPMGVGVLYSDPNYTADIEPGNFGGGIVRDVTFEDTQLLEFPQVVEAGTVDVAGVLGLGAAIDFINELDLNDSHQYEKRLAEYFRDGSKEIEGLRIIGEAQDRSGIVSFSVDGVHPHDVATFLAEKNIAVRAGHHCAQPLLHAMGVQATVRISFSIYNSEDEVEKVLKELHHLVKFWK